MAAENLTGFSFHYIKDGAHQVFSSLVPLPNISTLDEKHRELSAVKSPNILYLQLEEQCVLLTYAAGICLSMLLIRHNLKGRNLSRWTSKYPPQFLMSYSLSTWKSLNSDAFPPPRVPSAQVGCLAAGDWDLLFQTHTGPEFIKSWAWWSRGLLPAKWAPSGDWLLPLSLSVRVRMLCILCLLNWTRFQFWICLSARLKT